MPAASGGRATQHGDHRAEELLVIPASANGVGVSDGGKAQSDAQRPFAIPYAQTPQTDGDGFYTVPLTTSHAGDDTPVPLLAPQLLHDDVLFQPLASNQRRFVASFVRKANAFASGFSEFFGVFVPVRDVLLRYRSPFMASLLSTIPGIGAAIVIYLESNAFLGREIAANILGHEPGRFDYPRIAGQQSEEEKQANLKMLVTKKYGYLLLSPLIGYADLCLLALGGKQWIVAVRGGSQIAQDNAVLSYPVMGILAVYYALSVMPFTLVTQDAAVLEGLERNAETGDLEDPVYRRFKPYLKDVVSNSVVTSWLYYPGAINHVIGHLLRIVFSVPPQLVLFLCSQSVYWQVPIFTGIGAMLLLSLVVLVLQTLYFEVLEAKENIAHITGVERAEPTPWMPAPIAKFFKRVMYLDALIHAIDGAFAVLIAGRESFYPTLGWVLQGLALVVGFFMYFGSLYSEVTEARKGLTEITIPTDSATAQERKQLTSDYPSIQGEGDFSVPRTDYATGQYDSGDERAEAFDPKGKREADYTTTVVEETVRTRVTKVVHTTVTETEYSRTTTTQQSAGSSSRDEPQQRGFDSDGRLLAARTRFYPQPAASQSSSGSSNEVRIDIPNHVQAKGTSQNNGSHSRWCAIM